MLFGVIFRLIRDGIYIPIYGRYEFTGSLGTFQSTVLTHALHTWFPHQGEIHILSEFRYHRTLQFHELLRLVVHGHESRKHDVQFDMHHRTVLDHTQVVYIDPLVMPIGVDDDKMSWEREGDPLETKYLYIFPSSNDVGEFNIALNSA